MINPSKHFEKNFIKRTGFNRKALYDYLVRASERGIKISDIEGRLKVYLTGKLLPEVLNNSIVYDKFIIVADDNNIGITFLKLPREFRHKYQSIAKRKYDKEDIDDII